MKITIEDIKAISPATPIKRIAQYIDSINATMVKYKIFSPLRQAHFLAQLMHESGGLRYHTELASGAKYEGRKDLGNKIIGDGKRFKGRGFIQLTGRANYKKYGTHVKVDLELNPELVATTYPADVSGWFWDTHKLNILADADNITLITRRINGGLNGFKDREGFLTKAKNVLLDKRNFSVNSTNIIQEALHQKYNFCPLFSPKNTQISSFKESLSPSTNGYNHTTGSWHQ